MTSNIKISKVIKNPKPAKKVKIPKPRFTFKDTNKPNHSIRARLIKYLNETNKESKDSNEFNTIAIYNGKAFSGRNKLECIMNIMEYKNNNEKFTHPIDSFAWALDIYFDDMDIEISEYLEITNFDASNMTDNDVEKYIEILIDDDEISFATSDIIKPPTW